MKKIILILFTFFFVFFPGRGYASNLEGLLEKAQKLNLSANSTWLKLLHFERNDDSSVVLADDFFISPEGRENSDEELKLTIRAYLTPWGENNVEHPRCVFPARYYWLSQYLDLPNYKLREERCQKLESWALFDKVNSVSLLLVSGYFGNPASTFGHGLLKFNTDSQDDMKGMFDSTLTYGAVIPEDEGALRYVFQGLFGGYKAGFSDRYYYTKDLVYSRKEYRDIWDYRLQLTEYQRTLLILHIWEIVGKKFTYYFLNKNCAFRLAELIDLVIEEDFISGNGLWYLPVNMFHQLNKIHKARVSHGKKGLISNIQYIPSAQRKLYRDIKDLRPLEIKVINEILKEEMISISGYFDSLSIDQRINILDALLAYQQYRITSVGDEEADLLKRNKKVVMLERLSLPPKKRQEGVIANLASPAEGTRPMESDMAYAFDKDGDPYVRLSWAPFKKEIVGQNSLDFDELVVFDIALGVLDGGEKIKLDQFDLIRILNLNLMSLPFEQEKQWSWNLRVGSNRIGKNNDDQYDGVFNFGVGSAKKINSRLAVFFMMDAAAHTIEPYGRLRPNVGAILDFGKYKARLSVGVENDDYTFEVKEIWGGQMQYQFSNRSAFKVEVSNERVARYSMGFSYYW